MAGAANNPDVDALSAACRWQAEGLTVALAVVTATWGSSPRPVGSLMAVNDMGQFAGSVSGGCVEGAVLLDAKKAMTIKRPVRQAFGVSDEEAWAASLACGGQMEVLTLPAPALEPLMAARRSRHPAALAIRLDGNTTGIVTEMVGTGGLSHAETAIVQAMLEEGRTGLADGGRLFVLSFPVQPLILIVGATHIAQVLAELAPLAGFDVAVTDPRHAFNDPARFPGIRHSKDAPAKSLAELGLDRSTAVVALTHQPGIDDEALRLALQSSCFYIGALGSKATHKKRLERLGQGAARIHGPIGLDIGARTAGEIAVAILAQVIEAWRKERRAG